MYPRSLRASIMSRRRYWPLVLPAHQASPEQPQRRRFAAPVLGLCLLATAVPVQSAAQLYRWVDDQGNVHYTDSIPAEYQEKGHTVMSPRGTQVLEVPPMKTPEEIQRERELTRLRGEQQRLIEQQKTADQMLLRTFRSVDDLIMAQEGKLAAIDVMIQVTKSSNRRMQDTLNRLNADAADFERGGNPVPEGLHADIEHTERSLQDGLALILSREQQKQALREQFARELKRFRQLKEIAQVAGEAEPGSPVAMSNVVSCADNADCDRRWLLAKTYLERHATLPIESNATDVVFTTAPSEASDIGLILARIWNKGEDGASILLDVQCRSYHATAETCSTPERRAVLEGFAAAIEAADRRIAAD